MNNALPDLALDAYQAATESSTVRSRAFLTDLLMIASIREKLSDTMDEDTDLKLLTIEAKVARAEGDDDSAVELLTKIVERDSLNGDAL